MIFPALIWLLLCPAAFAQQNSSRATGSEAQLKRLSISIEHSIQSEKSQVSDLAAELSRVYSLEKSIKDSIDAFNLQRANFQSLMVLPQVPARQLDDAFNALQAAYAAINKQHEKLHQQKEKVEEAIVSTTDQLTFINGQQQSISSLNGSEKLARSLFKKTAQLKELVLSKKKNYQRLQNQFTKLLSELEKSSLIFDDLSHYYKQALEKSSSQQLFQRSVSLFSSKWPSFMAHRLTEIETKAETAFSWQDWQVKIGLNQPANLYVIVSLLLLLLIVGYLGHQLARYLAKPYWTKLPERYPTIGLPLALIQKSVVNLIIAVFLAVYLEAVEFSGLSSLLRLAVDLLSIWIITSWALVFTVKRLISASDDNRLAVRLKRLILYLRWFGIVFLVLGWLFQYGQAVMILGRYVLELTLVGFSVSIWQSGHSQQQSGDAEIMNHSVARHLLSGLVLIIAVAGLILEIAGYGSMALFWYLSWGYSSAIILWGWLLVGVLKELGKTRREQEKQEKREIESLAMVKYQLKWLLVRVLQLAFPIGVLFMLVIAWGGRRFFQNNVYAILNYSFKIGDIGFSLLSIIQAILVLLITHIITKIWRFILKKRFLKRSRMEVGLKDSITAITAYLIWSFGIILALNSFGLNPTSLVVVFGALGIGLGFGLQNIFNNFMSGLILLFERPIQVGDDIEINGVWATVRKINVRSTLVQTYDNASLIIPNSDLINSQVTNWSFKDKRLRRKIKVGVAYGSDIELVRRVLLEVANETKNVLKYPAPDVMFSDFGDSALQFVLRIWTYVDLFLEVETNIRFKIDEKFRENDIVIAFPQQDIHLYPAEVSEHKNS